MRTLAIGDIHGCLTALTTLAAFVPIQPDDQLVTLGDYVDRGPDTRGVIDWLIERGQTGNLIPIRGNHDIMMMLARNSKAAMRNWLVFGGREAVESYGSFDDIPQSHWDFLENTRRYFETPTHLFVHANVLHDCPLDQQPDETLFWEKFINPLPHESGKVMVCGHTSQKSGRPRDIGHAICIDTWVFGDGWLTCMDVDSGFFWQANDQGETRVVGPARR